MASNQKKASCIIVISAFVCFIILTLFYFLVYRDVTKVSDYDEGKKATQIIGIDLETAKTNVLKKSDIVYSIDEMGFDNNILFVEGWIVPYEISSDEWDCRVVLFGKTTNTAKVIPTQLIPRPDVKEDLKKELSYDEASKYCGYYGVTKDRDIIDSNEEYEVKLLYKLNGKDCLVDTGAVLTKAGAK